MSFSTLNLAAGDTAGLENFYCNILGMRKCASETGLAFELAKGQCTIRFTERMGGPYVAGPADFYWKIGLTVRDLDHAVSWLKRRNWPVSEPHQFRDIGYLCSLTDPAGFKIELLQQGFEGNKEPAGVSHPVGDQATFAHITLRVTDIETATRFCRQTLGLTLVSVQPVSDLGFCLYFFSFKPEAPPNPDIESVSNREWLWRRPYTILELQHLERPDATIVKPHADQPGFIGLSICSEDGSGRTFEIHDLDPLQ